MCKCTPELRTTWCGKPGCEAPERKNVPLGASKSPILKYFNYDHLPPRLREVSAHFHATANWVESNIPGGPEKSAGLRKLLEAKDCIVRASLEEKNGTR